MNDERLGTDREKTYRIEWSIDIDAVSAEDAARQALAIQRDPESIATVFHVEGETIDLTELDQRGTQ